MTAEGTNIAATAAAVPTAAEAAEIEELLACRTYLYTLFHKLFGGTPNADLLKALFDDATAQAIEPYAQNSAIMRSGAEFLRTLIERDSTVLLDQMRDEYTRLFIGPAELVAYPWEAPYVSKQAAVCQESTVAVRKEYRAQGLEPRKLLRVPDDHVSIMCAFAATLGKRASDAFLAGSVSAAVETLRIQEAFELQHMGNWLPEYARLARRSKTAVLYPQMIEIFAELVRLDAVFLSEAAFWLESLDASPEGPHLAELESAYANDGDMDAVGALRQATKRVAELQLTGIEDNELVPSAA